MIGGDKMEQINPKYTRAAIVSILNENKGDLIKSKDDLKVSLKTLYNWIEKHKIKKGRYYS